MKKLLTRSIQILALLVALAVPAFSEQSNRGLYEGDLSGGGKIIFFVQANHVLSVSIFDVAGQAASLAPGKIKKDGTFSLTTSANETLSGSVAPEAITATFQGQTITAPRATIFGHSGNIAGRFTGFAHSNGNFLANLKFIVDSQNNIFMIGWKDGVVIGGFGTVTVEAKPKSDHDDSDAEEDHEDENAPRYTGTFTLTLVTGETVTGTLAFGHGVFTATFILDGVQYTYRGSEESTFNRLANISTRGFVNTGQGQLIGGFIITGGPKLVLIRALGPTLTGFGVSPVLANPKLRLAQDQTTLAENDDWQSASNARDIIDTTIPPRDAKESAILMHLEPGAYTTVVTGSDDGTGIALIEVYEINRD